MCIAVRSISGHKAAICSLDFLRYGDILASGSMDTNLKVQPNFVLWVYKHLASVQGSTVFITCSSKFCINFILRVTNAVEAWPPLLLLRKAATMIVRARRNWPLRCTDKDQIDYTKDQLKETKGQALISILPFLFELFFGNTSLYVFSF